MGSTLLLIGDVQQTSFLERMVFREANTRERKKLAADIFEQPSEKIVFLGDLTVWGGVPGAWKNFDQLFGRLSAREKFAVVGNHDYWGSRSLAKRELIQRFPHLTQKSYGCFGIGGLKVLYLNSNFKELSSSEQTEQQNWYESELHAIDRDAECRWCFVLTHHPPFTHAPGRRNARVEDNFIPAFLRAQKTSLFCSGHAHTYEHFEVQGKKFVVAGAAGAPRVKLTNIRDASLPDLYPGPALRPFHYLKVTVEDKVIQIEVRGFQTVNDPCTVLDCIRFSSV